MKRTMSIGTGQPRNPKSGKRRLVVKGRKDSQRPRQIRGRGPPGEILSAPSVDISDEGRVRELEDGPEGDDKTEATRNRPGAAARLRNREP